MPARCAAYGRRATPPDQSRDDGPAIGAIARESVQRGFSTSWREGVGDAARDLGLQIRSARFRSPRQQPFGEVEPLLDLAHLLPQLAHLGFERF